MLLKPMRRTTALRLTAKAARPNVRFLPIADIGPSCDHAAVDDGHFAGEYWLRFTGLVLAILVPLATIYTLSRDPGSIAAEPEGRDNSPAAIHQRIMVFDGALGSGAAPCNGERADTALAWRRAHVDSGIWWVQNGAEVASVECWLEALEGKIRLATRAGDAPALHTAGTRSIYIGVQDTNREELAGLYRRGVRFARAPKDGARAWLVEAKRLGIVADVSRVPDGVLSNWLSHDAPPLLYGWQRRRAPAPDLGLIRQLTDRRDGVLLMLPSPASPLETQDMLACLQLTSWEHCAVGGAARPLELSAALLEAGYTEGNLARMYGFDLLRVLRKAEVWSGQR